MKKKKLEDFKGLPASQTLQVKGGEQGGGGGAILVIVWPNAGS